MGPHLGHHDPDEHAVAALGIYHVVAKRCRAPTAAVVLVSLAAAGVTEVLVDDLLHVVRARRFYFSTHGRSADLALITSGMLMSVGFKGIGGQAGIRSAGCRSASPSRSWRRGTRSSGWHRSVAPTSRPSSALSVVPELAGLVRSGHAERVAELSVDLGHELHLSSSDIEYLRAAALLHHLGHLCLDDPGVRGRSIEPSEVTDKGAEILRQTDYLRPAGDLLASDTASVGSQILRVRDAFDELTAGDTSFTDAAIEALYSGPGYVYDPRVLDTLERVAGTHAQAAQATATAV